MPPRLTLAAWFLWSVRPGCSLDNGVDPTPAMGWSSWNHFLGNVNESLLIGAADVMVSSGLREAGYKYINLDDGWAVARDSMGRLVADSKKFPNGIKYVADEIHKRGLKFGLYTARGSRTCMGRPGSDSHEVLDAQTFADWGVDYLKEDSCGGTYHGTIWEQYALMRDALNRTGRPIYFSITQLVPWDNYTQYRNMWCPGYGGLFSVKDWVQLGLDPATLANAYLVEFCNNLDNFGYTNSIPAVGGFLSNLDAQALLTFDNLTRPGAFNDNDMLQVCNGGQTKAEYRAQFSTWAILTSPLILGHDILNMDNDCKEIVMNKEIIAINQDPLVSRGSLVYQWPDPIWPESVATKTYSAQPAPSVQGDVGMARCDSGPNSTQDFVYDPADGALRLASSNQCLTYLGFKESYLFLAPCESWSAPQVGGQTWTLQNGSIWLRNNTKKCLDVFNCNVSAAHAAQVCTCDDPGAQIQDCWAQDAARQQCGDANLRWSFSGHEGKPGKIATEVDGHASCLTAVPLPKPWVNISMQVWGKPLHDGSVAVVAFNRDALAANVTIKWWWFGVEPQAALSVRDLWQHANLGVHTEQLQVQVDPHDARALRLHRVAAASDLEDIELVV
eukprot:TRINITY_DN30326_c0_g1_i2.p1 TRINITY_DN30326_c0_g1~~TRINITY_DN30326_c0_g1_i2.p1  ORF type:complete len:634 (-),score=99.44 TRINITY_DN30326_c0_g1_i2:327-2171(-)